MAIAYVDAQSAEVQSTATTNLVCTGTLPTGLAQNDVMLMSISSNRGTTESLVSDPTSQGWTLDRTQADGAETTRYYHKVAGSSESAPVATFTNANAGIHSLIIQIMAYRSVDTSAPVIDENSAPETGAASTTTHVGPTLTNTDAGAWGVSMMTERQNASPQSWTAGSGLTKRLDKDAGIGTSNNHCAIAQDTHGVLATGSWTPQADTPVGTAAVTMWSVLLKPSTGGGGGGGGGTIEFSESFEGAADGVGATNSTTGFNSVVGASSAMTHSTVRSILGSKSLRIFNPTGTNYLYNALSPARGTIYQRVYFYMADWTNGTTVMGVQLGTTQLSNIQVPTSAAKFRLRDGSTVTASSTMTPTVGQWYRLELKVDHVGGTHTLRLFTGANLHGTTPDEELSGSVSSGTGGFYKLEDNSGFLLLEDGSGSLVSEDYVAGSGTFDRVVLGTNASNTLDWYLDAYADAPDGWVGPASFGAPSADRSDFFLVL